MAQGHGILDHNVTITKCQGKERKTLLISATNIFLEKNFLAFSPLKLFLFSPDFNLFVGQFHSLAALNMKGNVALILTCEITIKYSTVL